MCEQEFCIYCKMDSSKARSLEHVIPEALGCKITLPKGYVCDPCNNYFSKVDKNILLNRYMAIHVGTAQIPGKKEKIRKSISEKLNFPEKDHFEIVLGPVTVSPGSNEALFQLEQSKEFDELLFARGIHKIAFNSFAYKYGSHNALHYRFNELRRYVKKPCRNELWTYAVKESYSENKFIATLYNKGMVVDLRMLCFDFLVSLTGWDNKIERDLKGDNIFVIREKGQWNSSNFIGLKR